MLTRGLARLPSLRMAASRTPALRAPSLLGRTPVLQRVWTRGMGELNYTKDQKSMVLAAFPRCVRATSFADLFCRPFVVLLAVNRLPVTVLNQQIGKDNLPPPCFEQAFRPYKSRQVTDEYVVHILSWTFVSGCFVT